MIIVKKAEDLTLRNMLADKLNLKYDQEYLAFTINEDESVIGLATFTYINRKATILDIKVDEEYNDPVYIELGLRAVLNFFDRTGSTNVVYKINDEKNSELAKRMNFLIKDNSAEVNTTEFFSRKCEGSKYI